jgi:hypothetical protein
MAASGYSVDEIPKASNLLEKHKDRLIKELLTNVKEGSGGYANRCISSLKNIGLTWPELDIIRKSILADRALRMTEAQEDVGYPASAVIDRIRDAKETGSTNAVISLGLSNMKYDDISPSHQGAALEPHAAEVADYLDWTLSKAPKEDAIIAQGFRLLNIGCKWPQLKQVIEKHKDQYVWYILRRYKQYIDHNRWTDKDVLENITSLLQDFGITWPELATIQTSLEHAKNLPESLSLSALKNEFRQFDDLVTPIKNKDWPQVSTMYQSAVQSGRAGTFSDIMGKLADTLEPDVFGDFVTEFKHAIVTFMLQKVKEQNIKDVAPLLSAFEKANIDWPELNIIKRSLQSENLINEGDDDQVMRDFIIGSVKSNLKNNNVGAIFNIIMADLKTVNIPTDAKIAWHKKNISPLLNRSKPKITKWFDHAIDAVLAKRVSSGLKLLKFLDVDPPDVVAMLNAKKDHIVKRYLEVIKNHSSVKPVIDDVHLLKTIGIDWPELDVIQGSAQADDKLTEAKPAKKPLTDYWLNFIKDDIMHDNMPNVYSAVQQLKREGYDILGSGIPALLNEHKDLVIKHLLKFLKQSLGKDYLERHVSRYLYILKKICKITWPELATIETSFKASKS